MVFKSKKAFTLAEILIVLIVLGVISALTVPVLVNKIQDQQFKVAWKKTYANLADAALSVSVNNKGNLSGVFTGPDAFRSIFQPYLNYTKLCHEGTPTGPDGCWHSPTSWYKLSGDVYNLDRIGNSRMILSNGVLLSFNLQDATCNSQFAENHDNCGYINVDVNGFKGPNTVGRDIFALMVLRDGSVIPWGTQGDVYYNDPDNYSCNVKDNTASAGWNCSADYLYK